MFKSLCPSSYCCELRLGACRQKVSNGALDLACHALQRLLLILLLWAVEEFGSCTPFIPATIKVLGGPVCLLSVCVRVYVCVLVCVIALYATSYPRCHNVLSTDAAQGLPSFSVRYGAGGHFNLAFFTAATVQHNFSRLIHLWWSFTLDLSRVFDGVIGEKKVFM